MRHTNTKVAQRIYRGVVERDFPSAAFILVLQHGLLLPDEVRRRVAGNSLISGGRITLEEFAYPSKLKNNLTGEEGGNEPRVGREGKVILQYRQCHWQG